MTLSRHTAPIVQPRPRKRLCPSRGAPPIAGWPQVRTEQRSPFAPAPLQSLHHYYELPRPCAPHRYSDPRGGLPLGSLPSHRGDRFPRSVQEPGSESRRLHAGCRLGRNQDTPQTYPGLRGPDASALGALACFLWPYVRTSGPRGVHGNCRDRLPIKRSEKLRPASCQLEEIRTAGKPHAYVL